MKKHICFIIDKSGSMYKSADDVIGGFASFLNEQKKLPDECSVSVTLFDTHIMQPYINVDIFSNPSLLGIYIPDGMTALFDAIGRTITQAKNVCSNYDKTIIVIMTDGYENSSKEYRGEDIRAMINDLKEKHGVEFVYFGANQDAFGEAEAIGIKKSFNYEAKKEGISYVYDTLSKIIDEGRR